MDWLSIIAQGTLLGGFYALFAIGLSLVFGIMRLVNIAHGDFITLAAFAALLAVRLLGIHPLLALLIVVPLMFAVGYVLQRYVLHYTLGPDILPPLLVTFGLSVVIENLLLQFFGADTERLQAGALQTASLKLTDSLSIGVFPLLVLIVAVLSIAALQLLFYRTGIGRAFRATSDDPATAELMGIDNRRLYALAMAIGLGVTGMAALFFAIRNNFDPTSGPDRLIYAFEAVIIGGLGSLWGTLAGGIILGIAQSIGAALHPEWQILAGHVAFLAVLVLRPNGLFQRTRD